MPHYFLPNNKFTRNLRLPLKPTIPHIMLIDMNSFFASVEQQSNPFFRNKPLGVCASIHPTSCLIAASREAKRLGIKTGTLIWKARKIYPKIILVQSEPEKYREVNRRFNNILADYTDRIEAYSIDESFLDLSQSRKNSLAAATEIKKRMRRDLGEVMTSSIGIAPNKFMAKLAADMEKPDGLTVIWRENLPEIYKTKKFSDLWGLARGWTERLMKLGMKGPGDVLSYPLANLVAAYGKPGYYIWQRINGLEVDEITSEEEPPKSFGHSWVLNFRTTEKPRLAPVVLRLAEKAARRMRLEGFKANGIYLSVRLVDGSYLHQSKKLKYTVTSGLGLYEEALMIWRDWLFPHEIMHIAVGFFSLVKNHEQMVLFGKNDTDLNNSIDIINNKYGEFTIRSGLLTKSQGFAPDAIAFGR